MTEILTLLGNSLPTVTPMVVLLIILLSFYRAVSEGSLIPSATHMRIIEAKDREIATLQQALAQANNQVDKLIDMGETNIRLIQALTPPGMEDK